MNKTLIALFLASLACTAQAEIFKCQGANGKTQFSDTPCPPGQTAKIVPDRAPITEQQHADALQRAQTLENATTERTAGNPTTAAPATTAKAERSTDNDGEAIRTCVRDVERQGASVKTKGDLIAACQSAGAGQRKTGLSGDTVSDDKARQIALCHGGDVQPEIPKRHRNQPG